MFSLLLSDCTGSFDCTVHQLQCLAVRARGFRKSVTVSRVDVRGHDIAQTEAMIGSTAQIAVQRAERAESRSYGSGESGVTVV